MSKRYVVKRRVYENNVDYDQILHVTRFWWLAEFHIWRYHLEDQDVYIVQETRKKI